jgi:hypothetical protein
VQEESEFFAAVVDSDTLFDNTFNPGMIFAKLKNTKDRRKDPAIFHREGDARSYLSGAILYESSVAFEESILAF